MPLFANTSRGMPLPAAGATPAAMFSVPKQSGGYDYYQAPPGTNPAINNDFPTPNVAHPNDVGVSSLHVGREMPPGCVLVGSGPLAIGSVTAQPGAGGEITGIEALGAKGGYRGMGEYAFDSRPFGRWPLRGYGDDGSLAIQPEDLWMPDFSNPTTRILFAGAAIVAVGVLGYIVREDYRSERA